MHPPADEPLRVTGKVKGDLNGVALAEADLHSYVLTGDGRTYTAVSRVPKVSQPPIESIGRRGTRSLTGNVSKVKFLVVYTQAYIFNTRIYCIGNVYLEPVLHLLNYNHLLRSELSSYSTSNMSCILT